MKRLLMISFLGATVFVAAAHASEPPAVPATSADASAQVQDGHEAKKHAFDDRNCLRHTGTRISSRTDRKDASKCGPGIGRAYTREELERTGRIDLADALRALDPSIH